MKEVYVILNYDIDEVVSAADSYERAQEIVLDMYMDDLYYEFLWGVNYEGQSAAKAYEEAKFCIDSFYRNYIVIQKVELE